MLPVRAALYCVEAEAAGRKYGVNPLLILAVMDRETLCGTGPGYSPRGPAGKGDGGHGHGLMQIDGRYHAEWLALKAEDGTPLWQIPAHNIEKGASILAAALKRFADEELACCAYNAGVTGVQRAIERMRAPRTLTTMREAANTVTTRGNYGSDVMRRMAEFVAPPKEATS